MDSNTKKKLITWLEAGKIDQALAFLKLIETTDKGQISNSQRGALHLYLSQVAAEANNQGLTLQDMIKVVNKLEIRPNTSNLKETFLKPYILSAYNLQSSEKMTNQQITETYDALNKLFSYYWQIYFPFPTDEEKQKENLVGVKLKQVNNLSNADYPEYNGEPNI